MAYDEGLAQRLCELLAERDDVSERRMFGGLAFMLSGNMCCGIVGDSLMARVGPERYTEALAEPHVREMDFTGRPMRGFVYVAPAGFESDSGLQAWIERCVAFVDTLPAK